MKPPLLRPQRILITGDRDWVDRRMMLNIIKTHLPIEVIIHGCARGADTLAGQISEELNIPVDEFPADWDKYHKAAGHIRNQQMLTEGKPTLVLAFHLNIMESKGTRDMIKRSLFAKLPVYLNGDQIFSLPPT